MSRPQTFDEYQKMQAEIDEISEVERIVLRLKLGIAAFEVFVQAVERNEPGRDLFPAAYAALDSVGDSSHEATKAIHRMVNEWAARNNVSLYADTMKEWGQ